LLVGLLDEYVEDFTANDIQIDQWNGRIAKENVKLRSTAFDWIFQSAFGAPCEIVQGYISSPLAFMLLCNGLLLIVGCLMTSGEAILIFAPLLAPLALSYGYDKVLFGIIMIVNLEIGFLTPPVGLNLLVAMSTFKQKFGELIIAAAPFVVLMLGCLAVVAWQPWIAMALVGH
jgi:TRAP-type C4-dicarboxylate transport system permease large subunit